VTQPRRLDFNDPAPDLSLSTADGKAIQISSLWAKSPALLAFARHFGCTQCKMMLDQISENREKLEQAHLTIAIITQGTPAESREFCARYAPDLMCLADPERKSYEAFGLEKGNLYQTMLSPDVWKGVSKAAEKGYHLEQPPPGQDAMQMSGLFVIGTDGRIRLPYYYDDIADHPPIDLLLGGVLSTPWDTPFDKPLGNEPQGD
jgi:peroxiredoxin